MPDLEYVHVDPHAERICLRGQPSLTLGWRADFMEECGPAPEATEADGRALRDAHRQKRQFMDENASPMDD